MQISKNENEALPATISVYKVSSTEFSCQFFELTHLFWKKHITVEKMLLSYSETKDPTCNGDINTKQTKLCNPCPQLHMEK